MCISPGMKTSMHPAHKTEGWEAQSHCCLDPASLPQKELHQRQLKSRGRSYGKSSFVPFSAGASSFLFFAVFYQVNICYTSGHVGWWWQRRRLRREKMSEVMMKDYTSTLSRKGVSRALLKKQG